MHPDGVDVSSLSGFVPRVEDLLEGFSSGWVGEEEMALFGDLIVGLLHHNGSSDGLDGSYVLTCQPHRLNGFYFL